MLAATGYFLAAFLSVSSKLSNSFMTDSLADENICGCGREMNDPCHETKKYSPEDRGTWNFRDHTALYVTGKWRYRF